MIGFVIVGMMNTESVTKSILSHTAKLASVTITGANAFLEGFAKAGRVLLIGNAALPHGIIFTRQSVSNSQSPFLIFRQRFSALFRSGFHFIRPCIGHFSKSFGAMFPSCTARLALRPFAHGLFMLWCSLVSASIGQCFLMTLRATFNTPFDRSAAINTQIWFLTIHSFAHGLTSIT